jgi:LmbE family N-acetylglucosaminyl deacetylase
MKILAIGAHFDDVELGCGASLLRWGQEGHELHVLTVTRSGYQNPKGEWIRTNEVARHEGEAGARFLGAQLHSSNLDTLDLRPGEDLSRAILETAAKVSPDMVLAHWDGDAHRDHRSIGETVLHCFKHHPKVLFYQSNWYRGSRQFVPSYYVDVSRTFARKIELLAVHQSEFKRAGEKWTRWASAAAQLAGLEAGCEKAEAFEVVRWVEKA